MAVLERYGNSDYTYIAKVFLSGGGVLKFVYQAIFDALTTTFGLPKINLEAIVKKEKDLIEPMTIYELSIDGSIYSYRTTGVVYKALSTVVKNKKIKVMANVRRFVRLDKAPQEALVRFMNAFTTVMTLKYEFSDILQELQTNADVSYDEIAPHRKLYYRVVEVLSGVDIDKDGVYLSIFRTIDEAINTLNKLAEQMKNAITELKKLYLRHRLLR
jgi:hypothetical protein